MISILFQRQTQSKKKQIERGKLDSLSTHIYDHMPRTDISIKCGGVKLVVLFCPHLPSSWNEAVMQVFIIDFVSNITMTNVSDASFQVDNNWQNSYFSFIYLLTLEPIYQQSSYISEVFFWCYFFNVFVIKMYTTIIPMILVTKCYHNDYFTFVYVSFIGCK
jgi:hypothetical protein